MKTLMKVQEIFASDVTRDIPPVIYFHEQQPEKLQSEVQEYIITGGYNSDDPRFKRISDGIHEQYVRLLKSLGQELSKSGGSELPACWISGFYGSGKSSFAKLLGLSLDQRTLPGGKPLSEALLERDDSPRREEFREAWREVVSQIDPLAVVFDIGAVARDDEHIHSAVKRQLSQRLGYCPESHFVAEYELKLEQDGHWERFIQAAEETLGKPWEEAKKEQLAEDNFSEVMHALFPSKYEDPMSWVDFRTGLTGGATSVEETVKDIDAMLGFRAAGKTLFLVVDEVSQYIHQNDNRMLKLQSFVSALGQRLKGKVWLLATGQQKLEEDLEGSNLSKLKDRFPPRLRAHLAPTNIRDVVHRRLLKKIAKGEEALGDLFREKRSDLKNNGYKCLEITERDFVDVYPMLPSHVDLLMQITSNLRAKSSRMKGDDHAIRGLLQLLGELFREKNLGEYPFGSLVTLDQIYDVQYTALDADVQNTMTRLRNDDTLSKDEDAHRVAKAVALLELIQEQEPTTPELVAQCLYPRVGAGSQLEICKSALERLYQGGFLSRSEKSGYKIQSSAGQEWARERDSYQVTGAAISGLVHEKLRFLIGQADRPRFKGRGFPVAALYSDHRGARNEKLQSPNDPAVVTFEFEYFAVQQDRDEQKWLALSGREENREKILWVSGPPASLESKIKELLQCRHMVSRYTPRVQSMPEGRKRFLFEEQNRQDVLENDISKIVAEVFLDGNLYFRSRKLSTERHGNSFPSVLKGAGEEVLPSIYQHFVDLAVTDGEMRQLLEVNLSGVNHKFLDGGLGLLKLDAGKYVPSCDGEIVSRVRQKIEEQGGLSGAALLSEFGGPPCGYPPDLVKACVLGLLRGAQVRIRTSGNSVITSVRDPDVKDLFRGDKEFKKADFFSEKSPITQKVINMIRKLFRETFDIDFEPDQEHIADAAFAHFPKQRERLATLFSRINQLRPRPKLPASVEKLGETLEKCVRSRRVEETVLAIKNNLDAIRDGTQELGVLLGDLTDDAMEALKNAQRVFATELHQLEEFGLSSELSQLKTRIEEHLNSSSPWKGVHDITPDVEKALNAYRETRSGLLDQHEQKAEEYREKVKNREGFAALEDQAVLHVLHPIREALTDTTAEAVSPPLSFLRDSVPARLQEAFDEANRRLNKKLEEAGKGHVVELATELAGREVSSEQDVEKLLAELRERLLGQLKADVRIRLV